MIKALVKGWCILLVISYAFYFLVFDSPQEAAQSINLVDVLSIEWRLTTDRKQDMENRKAMLNEMAELLLHKTHIDITESIYDVLKNNDNFQLTERKIQEDKSGMFCYTIDFININKKKCSIAYFEKSKSLLDAHPAMVLMVGYEGQNNAPPGINIAHYVYGIDLDTCRDIASIYPRFRN